MFANARPSILFLALLTITADTARSYEPLPAGYERMVRPDMPSRVWFRQEIAENDDNLSFGSWSVSHRIVSLEIESFDPNPGPNDYTSGIPNHVVTVLEVPNLGPFWQMGTSCAVGLNEEQLMNFIGKWKRPIDIELYYRHDPQTGVMTATYGVVAVENSGKEFAVWDWIPPMPYHNFLAELEARYQQGWRPYDVEFAVDPSGEVVGTALLAENFPVTGRGRERPVHFVPTTWKWFDPETEPLLQEGWQLLDVEVPPVVPEGLHSGPFGSGPLFARYRETGMRFGVFVDTQFVDFDTASTFAGIESPHQGNWNDEIPSLMVLLEETARLIDIERDGEILDCNSDYCEPTATYTHVWLHEE